MSRVATQIFGQQTRSIGREREWGREWAKQAVIVIAASLFVALCARVTVPLPFTPVPLTLQNFGVLAVGLLLGSRRGFAALSLYLIEGAFGLPVFSPSILGGGIAQILGLSTRGICRGVDLRAQLTPFRLGRAVIPGCGSGALRWRTQLACRAHPLRLSGDQVWPLLVRFCGSHQGADGRRPRHSLAPTAFFTAVNWFHSGRFG
jgi:BioY family